MKEILVIVAHPSPSSFAHALAAAYAEGAQAHAHVRVLSLAELDFDPHLGPAYGKEQALEPDLVQARRAIEQADHVAWFFPTWWASVPALLKGFIDRVFVPGWAFRYEEGQALPTPLLRGRSARIVTTMDSPSWWYRFWHRRAVHAMLSNATLRFVGFGPVAHTTEYSLRSKSKEQREAIVRRLRKLGERDARLKAKRRKVALPG